MTRPLVAPTLIALLCLTQAASAAEAQEAKASRLDGTVTSVNGRPLADATVFLLETLEETRSDSLGRFVLTTTHQGLATVAVRRLGFQPTGVDVELPRDTTLHFRLVAQPPMLQSITVAAAGEYTLGDGVTATLDPLEVAQTPGAAANVARAIQTLPGVQAVDEGTGLFVRGGDVTETRVLIDEATFLSPLRFDNPTGHLTSTVDPFLLARTVFSAGGYGAAYGNALSGLVRMETAERPTASGGELTGSIGSVGAAGAWAITPRLGARGSLRATSLAPLVSVFGEAQPYAPPPQGDDASASLEWQSGPAGRLRLFALRQRNQFGVGGATAIGNAGYAAESADGLTVLSWRDSSWVLRPALTIGRSDVSRDETIGDFALTTRLENRQIVASLGWQGSRGVAVRAGAEYERLVARYAGSGSDRPTFDATSRLVRRGLWLESIYEHPWGARLTAGLRRDAASLGAGVTTDPRLALAYQRGRWGFTAAWGTYSQVAEPTFYRPQGPDDRFAPMRVAQGIVGLQWGGDTLGVRVEAYSRAYRDLWQFTRDFEPVGGGRGSARGMDLLARWRPFPFLSTRLSWSAVVAERSDPHTGRLAPAPGDIRHSVAWITQRQIGTWTIGSALRWATGRPFTDIVDAVPQGADLVPVFGNPNAERLPNVRRTDVNASWYRGLGEGRGLVLWGSIANVFNRSNVMRYRWSADFTERLPVRAPFNRSAYVGATLIF